MGKGEPNHSTDGKMANEKTDPKEINNYSVAYWNMRHFWTDALNLKEPLPNTLGQYLNRYPKEDDDEFAGRLKRLAQVNFVDGIIEFYLAMLFSTSVQISSTKHQKEVQSFVANCNAQGDSLFDYYREIVAPNALLYGVCDVFVDLPSVDGEVLTLQEQQERGLDAPYCYVVPALNRTTWELDSARNYVYYQSQDIINTQIASQMAVKDVKQFRQWTPKWVYLLDEDKKRLEDKPNPYGVIPAVTVSPLASMRYYNDRMGISLVKDIIPLQKMVLNLISLILDFHEQANFAQRVLIQDTSNGDVPPEEGELKEGGNKRGIVLYGANSKYSIVTPDANGVEAMCRFLDSIIDRIYQSAFIESTSDFNKTHQSAQTIRSNQSRLYNRLSRISKHFEKSMKQVVEMSLKVQGINPAEAGVSVQWDTNFSYEAFVSSLEELSLLRQTVGDISKTAVKEYAKKVVAPELYNTGKMDAINAEIDKWEPLPPVVPGKGKAGASKADTPPAPNEPQQDVLRLENSAIKASEQVNPGIAA